MKYEDIIGEIDENGDAVDWMFDLKESKDMVNSPSHYTTSKNWEAIDVIEEAVKSSEDPIAAVLQAQVLKYMLRLWLKEDPTQDACKAQWYMNRLVEHMTSNV